VILAASNLGKRYGAKWLFRRFEFELQVGDALAVVGANGSGKSTLAKILAGLLPASEGAVESPGCLGYSALDLALYPYLTVQEHLELAARLQGIEPRASELLERVGLARAADQPTLQISSGMRARLKLALAIQPEPDLLILDEPGASLDEDGRALVASIVEEQRRRGAVVLATNDDREVSLCSLQLHVGGGPS